MGTITPTVADDHEIIAQITQILDGLQPYIMSHGGRVEFVKLEKFVVFIKFYGTCVQCPLSFYTLTYGIERHIKDKIPCILSVQTIEE